MNVAIAASSTDRKRAFADTVNQARSDFTDEGSHYDGEGSGEESSHDSSDDDFEADVSRGATKENVRNSSKRRGLKPRAKR